MDIAIGDRVEISGLRGDVSLNGSRGRIVSYYDYTRRLGVKLEGISGCKSVKASNLMVLSEEWADIVAVAAAAAQWNLSFADVSRAIDNWEELGILACNPERSKVQFVVPFFFDV